MIKVSMAPSVTTLLLTCGVAAASAATPAPLKLSVTAAACAGNQIAISELLAAAPGGLDALNSISVSVAVPTLAPRSELYDTTTYDTSRADRLLAGLAASARKSGKMKASRLFIRLMNEGTPAEKLQFMSANNKPYTFPARFTLAVATGGVCRKVAEVFCSLSCIHTGTAQEQCKEDCRTIFVESCD